MHFTFILLCPSLFLCVHSLACCDGHHLVDVVNRATTAEVVDRTGNTLEDRTECHCSTEAFHKFVGDVTYLEAWYHQHVSVSRYLAARCLLCTY